MATCYRGGPLFWGDERYAPHMVWYKSITRRFITDPRSGDLTCFTPSSPLVHDLVYPSTVYTLVGVSSLI